MNANNKPHALVGAGKLTATLWKSATRSEGCRYRFTIHRLARQSGRATQLLAPKDVIDLVKLARTLAQVLADDGCLCLDLKKRLSHLATGIDDLLGKPE